MYSTPGFLATAALLVMANGAAVSGPTSTISAPTPASRLISISSSTSLDLDREFDAKFKLPETPFGHGGSKTKDKSSSSTTKDWSTSSSSQTTSTSSNTSESTSTSSSDATSSSSTFSPSSTPLQQGDTTDYSAIKNTVACARIANDNPNRAICYPSLERTLPREDQTCWKYCQETIGSTPEVQQHGLGSTCLSVASMTDDVHISPGACGC